jgi:hypothetical protein
METQYPEENNDHRWEEGAAEYLHQVSKESG